MKQKPTSYQKVDKGGAGFTAWSKSFGTAGKPSENKGPGSSKAKTYPAKDQSRLSATAREHSRLGKRD